MLDSDKAILDNIKIAYEIVDVGQFHGIDWCEIVDYMQNRGFSDKIINTCFSTYLGCDVNVIDLPKKIT